MSHEEQEKPLSAEEWTERRDAAKQYATLALDVVNAQEDERHLDPKEADEIKDEIGDALFIVDTTLDVKVLNEKFTWIHNKCIALLHQENQNRQKEAEKENNEEAE